MARHKTTIKVTITKIFEVEFDDTLAASRMYKTMEQDRQIGVLRGASGDGWSARETVSRHTVEPNE